MVQLWPLACLLGDGDADRGSMPRVTISSDCGPRFPEQGRDGGALVARMMMQLLSLHSTGIVGIGIW